MITLTYSEAFFALAVIVFLVLLGVDTLNDFKMGWGQIHKVFLKKKFQ